MKNLLGSLLALLICFQIGTAVYASPQDPQLSEGLRSFDQSNGIEEPDGSGIPKDEPISTTGTTYGWPGVFDLNAASSERLDLSEGTRTLEDAQLLFWGGPIIRTAGTAALVVRDSYIRGETATETAPLSGRPGALLVSGSFQTALTLDNSESFYVNSSVISRNWAALSAEEAQPASVGTGREQGLYTYGTEVITMDGGYGALSNLLSSLFLFGSHVQAAEIGVISCTCGKVTVGTIEDGENNEAMAAVLTPEDRESRSDKHLGSVIEGGHNALMIQSMNLPRYWVYEGCSWDELPLLSAEITAHCSLFRTDLSLDREVSYRPQVQAYIRHSSGSVILIKSTNAEILLDGCELTADPEGTGNLIHTVCGNDIMFMNAVPDGESYPGIRVVMRAMNPIGDIVHEDYQRSFELTLERTALTGAVNEYDCEHWNRVSAEEGFPDYSLDSVYETHHGLCLTLQDASSWAVTEESHLSRLVVGEDCLVSGVICLNGEEQENQPGKTYEGDVVVYPYSFSDSLREDHVHEWERYGGNPPTCIDNATLGWVCTICGASYVEEIPGSAMGHDYIYIMTIPPSETDCGYEVYECSRCGMIYYKEIAVCNHTYVYSGSYDSIYHYYVCTSCGATCPEAHYGFPCFICGYDGPVG